jgi:hypothetical protein
MQTNTKTSPIIARASYVATKTFYACPSGRAKVLLDQQLTAYGLLDNGSEVIMMPRRGHERLELPIDTSVNWHINGYDAKIKGNFGRSEVCRMLSFC